MTGAEAPKPESMNGADDAPHLTPNPKAADAAIEAKADTSTQPKPAAATTRVPADPDSAGPLPAASGAPAPRTSLALVAGFGVLVACLIVLGSLAEQIRAKELFAMDQIATPLLHSYSSPGLDALMNLFTTLGSTMVLAPVFAIAVLVLAVRRRFGSVVFLAVCSGGSLLLNEVMKLFFDRPRPSVPWAHVLPDPSFPSGHTMNSLALYVGLAVVAWSALGPRTGRIAVLAAVLLDLAIAVSRVYLGYHYVTDVVGGFLAGTSWILLTMAAFRWRAVGPFQRRTAALQAHARAVVARAGARETRSGARGS